MATYKTKKSKTGAQLYVSDRAKKEILSKPTGRQRSKASSDLTRGNTHRYPHKTPEQRGKSRAETYIDIVHDTYNDPPKGLSNIPGK